MSTLLKLSEQHLSAANSRSASGKPSSSAPPLPDTASRSGSDVFSCMAQNDTQSLHFYHQPESGLKAIIAIHSTQLGPALGGCRFVHYQNEHAAIADATRLARGMSYKAALAGIEHGGGKAVIMKPSGDFDRTNLYRAFGTFVNELGGRYITAVDSGTTLADMDTVAQMTPHVSGSLADGLDPSPLTALGVFSGIKAALAFKHNSDSLRGVRVAIQGLGQVGYALAKQLHEAGATLIVSDIDPLKAARAAQEFDARIVDIEDIYQQECEVFAPCGLGAIVNDYTYERFRCSIIAGSANNQLAEPYHGRLLEERGILYAPDYVINAGGLIKVALGREGAAPETIEAKILGIQGTLSTIFERASKSGRPPFEVADALAQEQLKTGD